MNPVVLKPFPALLLLVLSATGCTAISADPPSRSDRPDAPAHELLFQDTFPENLNNWTWSGPPGARVEIENGALLIDPLDASHRAPGTEGVNLWHRRPLEGDFALEFDIEPLAPGPLDGESANLLFMIDYRLADESLDFAETVAREPGHYPYLHGRNVTRIEEPLGIPHTEKSGYTITYYRINPADEPPYRMIVRRNPGFHLVEEQVQTAEDQWQFLHTVRIERRGRTIRLFQNEKLALETVDPQTDAPPHGGHFGLRSWKTKLKIHAVRAYRLSR